MQNTQVAVASLCVSEALVEDDVFADSGADDNALADIDNEESSSEDEDEEEQAHVGVLTRHQHRRCPNATE